MDELAVHRAKFPPPSAPPPPDTVYYMSSLWETHAIYGLIALDPVTKRPLPGQIIVNERKYNPHPDTRFRVDLATP